MISEDPSMDGRLQAVYIGYVVLPVHLGEHHKLHQLVPVSREKGIKYCIVHQELHLGDTDELRCTLSIQTVQGKQGVGLSMIIPTPFPNIAESCYFALS